MAGGDGTFLCGACVCFVLIPSVILIVLSFATLQPVEYGLNFNAITMSLENATYSQAGLYFLGFGHWFIRYPRTIQTIEFMATGENQLLHTRTADGLPLTLGLSFQYRYMPEHLNKLYLTYKNEHHAVYVNTATAAIANVVREADSNPRPFALLEPGSLCPLSLQSAEGRTFESHSGSFAIRLQACGGGAPDGLCL